MQVYIVALQNCAADHLIPPIQYAEIRKDILFYDTSSANIKLVLHLELTRIFPSSINDIVASYCRKPPIKTEIDCAIHQWSLESVLKFSSSNGPKKSTLCVFCECYQPVDQLVPFHFMQGYTLLICPSH